MRSRLATSCLRFVRAARLPIVLGVVAVVAGAVLGNTPVAAGGAACHEAPAREGTNGTVEMKIMCFAPTVMRVQPGTTVKFVNRDEMTHLVTGVAYKWGTADQVGPGSTTEVIFDAPGTYPYSCMLHYGMTGVIVVGDGTFSGGLAPAIRSSAAVPSSSGDETTIQPASTSTVGQTGRSRWLYAGMGALGGLAVAGVGFGVASSRRSGRS